MLKVQTLHPVWLFLIRKLKKMDCELTVLCNCLAFPRILSLSVFLRASRSLSVLQCSVINSVFCVLIKRVWVGHQCSFQKKTLAPARLKKTPHPAKPPHVPFSCLLLLRSHGPLTKASSPVEYHMFLVKPNVFFSSFKTSICQAKSIEKAQLLPFFFFFSPAWHVSEYFKLLRF